MLVLARKPLQRIFIGDDIIITVTEIDGRGVVRLGIEAPEGVLVLREELRGGRRRRPRHEGDDNSDSAPIG